MTRQQDIVRMKTAAFLRGIFVPSFYLSPLAARDVRITRIHPQDDPLQIEYALSMAGFFSTGVKF